VRFNPQEIAGSRVRLHYSVGLDYVVRGPSEFVLDVHAAHTARQVVYEEYFSVAPWRGVALSEDPVTRNRLAVFAATSGTIAVRYAAMVEITHRIVDPADIIAAPPSALEPATLRYVYPSRFCQADLVSQQAWDRFGSLSPGYGQVCAVRDWVRQTIRFEVGASCNRTSAVDTLRDGAGVCRDFAHTMIAFCRALNYPARFVTGIDYGADPALGPSDFHAYVEVFIGDDWYMFDPSGISPVTGLLRIGTGRDAADVSFATIFGPVRTGMPRISIRADDQPAHGFTLPARTELAVSTAF
jgi:transglutaminase-like putative cysteine protease